MNEFTEISLVILLATLVAFAGRILRQPMVISYIIAGVLAGPMLFNILHSEETIHLFSKLGITILLFIVGLGLNPAALKEVGKASFLGGLGQVVLTTAAGLGLALALGMSLVPALYVALALTFSSTIIILKLLSDKGDVNKLYGKIVLGFLVVQDLIATFVLIGISTFSKPSGNSVLEIVGMLGLKSAALAVGLYLFTKYVLKRLARAAAQNQEMLYLFSISWGLGMAALFTIAGFSVEIGALVAGMTLSTTAYATEIGSRLRPLRDFFILLFFVLLGSQIDLASAVAILPQALILSLFVLIGNPLIVIFLMKYLGYRKRTSFQASIAIGQISEFSLILAALGLSLHHLNESMVSLITMVGIITIAASTYMIMYADKLYARLSKFVSFPEKRLREKASGDEAPVQSVLFGFNRVGHDFVKALRSRGLKPLVVDYDPAAVERLQHHRIAHTFGDATDAEFLSGLEFKNIKMVASTLLEYESNLLILRTVRRQNPGCVVITLAQTTKEALKLYENGATYVLMPHFIGAEYASNMILKHGLTHESYAGRQAKHIASLRKRIDTDIVGTVIDDLEKEARLKRLPKAS